MTALSLRQWLAGTLLLAATILPAAAPPASDCGPDGRLTFICGVVAAEDSVGLPGTAWLLAGGLALGKAGAIHAIDTGSNSLRKLYPGGATNWDRRLYPDCPGPPDAARFSASGLALRPTGRGRALLHVVHNGARESIEILELDWRNTAPRATWIGCIPMPAHTNPNAVATLPDGQLAIVSMDDGAPDRMQKHVRGEAQGSVHLWQPGRGLRELPGIRLRGGNGIVATPDGRWLYVSAWSGGEIARIRVDGSVPLQIVPMGFLPDNLEWADDGSIWVAGQRPPVERIAGCTGNPCIADWLLAKLDPQTMQVRIVMEQPGSTTINYITGATEFRGRLYLNLRGEDRIAVLDP